MENPIKKYQRFFDDYVRDLTAFASLPVFGFLFLASLAIKRYDLAAQFFLAVVLTWALFFPIRYLVFRPRPKKLAYHNLLERLDASSFPSLHAARSVMLVLILSQLFVQLEARLLLWTLALGIMWSRLYLQKHRIEDLVVGSIMGLAIGYLLVVLV